MTLTGPYHDKIFEIIHNGVESTNPAEQRWGVSLILPCEMFEEPQFLKTLGVFIDAPCEKYIVDDDSPKSQVILRRVKKGSGYSLRIEYYPESYLKLSKAHLSYKKTSKFIRKIGIRNISVYDVFCKTYTPENIFPYVLRCNRCPKKRIVKDEKDEKEFIWCSDYWSRCSTCLENVCCDCSIISDEYDLLCKYCSK